MERPGWLAFACAMSLVAVALVANGFLLTQGMSDAYEEQSRVDPSPVEWYEQLAAPLIYAGAGLVALGIWPAAFGWARLRAKTVTARRTPAVAEAVGDEESPLMPPGFFGPAIKTRRVGAAPLIGLTCLALGLAAGAGALFFLGIATFGQTIHMEGRGLRTAVLWGQLVKFAGLPLVALAAICLGTAWGRWFPLGEVEVVETQAKVQRAATAYRFDRQA